MFWQGRRIEFHSAPIDRMGEATPLYTTFTEPGRKAGRKISIAWISYHNHSGDVATIWLESPAGTRITVRTKLGVDGTAVLDLRSLYVGDQDIYLNADVDNVEAQIGGTEI